MGSRGDSEDHTFDPNYVLPDNIDLETQNLITRNVAEETIVDRFVEDDVVSIPGKKGSKRKLISLVDETDYSDVEITPSTQKTKPRRKTSFGTASRKPMLQSTIDGGIGSSSQALRKSVPMKSVIRGGRRKTTQDTLSLFLTCATTEIQAHTLDFSSPLTSC
ncbi:unnamed protein product [Eruca vesicaria subsp. sativa]|uniref:Uncharacterized protein n=1 Tax=Eruca vesicaria subsp. sativa TaxID=29727 RepID=A0ABC8JX25_ERUVS|nr:unnamed protein product [Eruca vesicaria subsp. sativa]